MLVNTKFRYFITARILLNLLGRLRLLHLDGLTILNSYKKVENLEVGM